MADYTVEVSIPTVGPGGLPEAPEDSIIYGRRDREWVDMTAPANLQIRRGTAAEVAAITPLEGEPVWATDSKRLYIGDGVSAGGYIINPAQFVSITDTEVDNQTLLPAVSVTLPAQSSWALLLYLKVQLAEDATEVSLQIGRVVEGSSEYSALPNGVLADGYWRYYSETGITPTQSTMTDLEVVVSGTAGETVVVTQYFVALNTTAQSATIGLYGIADEPSATLGGYLKAERIA
jgi:hypothetical protein